MDTILSSFGIWFWVSLLLVALVLHRCWERGLNENTNGLIRQYIPKSCPISIVRHTDVSWIQDQLNHRPRKSLGYRTPAQVAKNEIYALEM